MTRTMLLLRQTQDALGNTVSAQSDYRVLQPEEVIDPNGNHSQIAFDALGMVVGTAVKGKITAAGNSESGDSFVIFTADLLQPDIDAFITNANPLTARVWASWHRNHADHLRFATLPADASQQSHGSYPMGA